MGSISILSNDTIASLEIERLNWPVVRHAYGPASQTPAALKELLAAQTPQECKLAYWKLENYVVVQGQVFEAAEYVVQVIMAALVKPDRPRHVRIDLLELLFQIIHGIPHQQEIERGMADLVERCKDKARQGLWLLYRELLGESHDAAKEIIELLDPDKSRIDCFVKMGTSHKGV